MDALRFRGSPFARFTGQSTGPGHPRPPPHPQHPQRPQPMGSHGISAPEPLIVVEESNLPEEQEDSSEPTVSNRGSLDIDSPVNPYLLSPWRDPREARKHSLPSQQVTDGITASQVRRLSERGGEGSGPTPKEAAFLATLSQAPAPTGRRHSVVTISKVPTTIFGRSRRESVAAYPNSNGSSRVLNSRRESNTGPPSTDPIGSIHNLQLDIMDDIYLQSRKARLKLWTSSNEKVCEVQTVDEAGTGQPGRRFTNRRYSECPQPGLASTFRRASELPQPQQQQQPQGSTRASTRRKKSGSGTGLLGSRSDIAGIFSSLTSSAMDMHRPEPEGRDGSSSASSSATATASSPFLSQTFQAAARGRATSATPTPTAQAAGGGGAAGGAGSSAGCSGGLLDPNAGRSTRSNSFDVSLLNNAKQLVSDVQDNGSATLTGWFAKRHTPLARKKSVRSKSSAVALSKDVLERLQKKDPLGGDSGKPKLKPRSKQKTWAESTKATVDATILGTAIEGFLRKSSNASMGGSGSSGGASTSAAARGATPKAGKDSGSASGSPAHGARRSRASASSSAQSQAGRAVRSTLNWFGKADEDDSKDTCDASLCATLKDLFVK
ncbi:pneumococcal serine-rich repeat protein isoform X1 [Drosophila eugracilis]|uniref:pneumococcal serine-rich repeat protein isoform X1 n=1 Tax=Drosophila eugracilis TaxID=29029 RepID=UPI0007E621E0|nr:pneumococcal serine-rich repeat protein isoform X1 [Drosophila eugracilis]XP_041674784.1 pneumococcal serine-rich repeat protein isoform X1 [Drosophila eugracilis]